MAPRTRRHTMQAGVASTQVLGSEHHMPDTEEWFRAFPKQHEAASGREEDVLFEDPLEGDGVLPSATNFKKDDTLDAPDDNDDLEPMSLDSDKAFDRRR